MASTLLRASGRSPYFRAGQRVILRYQEFSGVILYARFISASGEQQGTFQDASSFSQYGLLLVLTFAVWGAFKKYRGDPEGVETGGRGSPPAQRRSAVA